MSRYVIVSMPSARSDARSGFHDMARPADDVVDGGCAWLFRAEPGVDDPEEALRASVREFFESSEGRRVLQQEGMDRIEWCEAIAWIPDAVWERHGLALFRHPEVERIIVDAEEDLAEELRGGATGAGRPLPATAPSA
jgi:hypothetical protein